MVQILFGYKYGIKLELFKIVIFSKQGTIRNVDFDVNVLHR